MSDESRTALPVESLLDEDDFAILREEYESQEGLYTETEIFDA